MGITGAALGTCIAFALAALLSILLLVGWRELLPRTLHRVKRIVYARERVIVVGHRFVDNGQPVDIIKNVKRPSEILQS